MREGILNLLKFFFAILLIPAVIAVTKSFFLELSSTKTLFEIFISGVLTYVLLHIFVAVPVSVFRFGQKIFTELFRFSPWFSVVLPRVLPMGALAFLMILYLCQVIFKMEHYVTYFLFFSGFLLAMHLILTAQEIHKEDPLSIKPHYFFWLMITYILNLVAMAVLLDLNFSPFSSIAFLKVSLVTAKHLYVSLFQLILLR